MESFVNGDGLTWERAQRTSLNGSSFHEKEEIVPCSNQGYESYLWISLTFVAMSIPVGIGGNLMVFTSVYSNRSLRNANNALLVNLAAADLMTCSISAPISWVVIFVTAMMGQSTWRIPTVLCSVQVHFHIMSYSVQLFTLALIGLERHAAITHPFEKKKKRRRVIIGIIAGWILGLLFGIISTVCLPSTPVYVLCSCIANDSERSETEFHNSAHLYILTPLGISCFVIVVYYYFKIYLIVRKHVKERDISLGGRGGGLHGQPSRALAQFITFLRTPFCRNCRPNRVAPKNGLPTFETQQATHTEEEEPVPSMKSVDMTVPPHLPNMEAQTGSSQESMLKQVSEKSSFVSQHDLSSCLSSSSNMDRGDGMLRTSDIYSNTTVSRLFQSGISSSRLFISRKSLPYDLSNVSGAYDSCAGNIGFILSGNQLAIYDQIHDGNSSSSFSSGLDFRKWSNDSISRTPRRIAVEPLTVSGQVRSSISLPNLRPAGISPIFQNDMPIIGRTDNSETSSKAIEDQDPHFDREDLSGQTTTLMNDLSGNQKKMLKVAPLSVLDGNCLDFNTSNGTDVGKGENAATESQIHDVAPSANVVGSVCVFNPKNRERGRRNIEAGTAKRASYIIVVFSLCWLPLFIVTILHASSLIVTPLYMLVFFSCTVLVSSAINPIVYTVVNRSFRQEFKKIVRQPIKCLPC